MGCTLEHRGADITAMGAEDWAWFKQYNEALYVEDSVGIVARLNGERVAGCVFDHWTRASVHCHIVITNPLIIRHGWLEAIHRTGFNTGGKVLYALVPDVNAKSLNFCKRVGFTELSRMPFGWDTDSDMVVLALFRENSIYGD